MAQVVLRDLNKKYDEVHAVKDVNLTIRDKEFMVFVAPSGCGKTTTLRMVAGLEEITSGDISIGDRVVNDLPPKDRDIAMVFHKGQTVTLGIRPEDLRVGSGSDSPDLAFDAVVEVVEPLGSEILLDVAVAGQSVVCRVEPTVKSRPHDKIRLAFVPERIHFFDKTEAVIK